MLDQLRNGDTVIVWKLDRLARPTRDLLEQWKPYVRLAPAFIRCPNPGPTLRAVLPKLIMTVFAGIAEFERDLIRERTSADREAARRRGIHLCTPGVACESLDAR